MFLTLKVVKKNFIKPEIAVFQYILIILFLLLLNISETKALLQPPAEGRYKEYYADGTAKERGFYLHSQKHKLWYYYNPNGTIDRKEKWKEGILQWQIFYSKGRIIKTIDKNGVIKTRPNCGC